MNKNYSVEKITTQDSPTNQSIVINLSDINETNFQDYNDIVAKIQEKIDMAESQRIEKDKEKFPSIIKGRIENGTDQIYNTLTEMLSNSKKASIKKWDIMDYVWNVRIENNLVYSYLEDNENVYVSLISELTNTTFVYRPNLQRYDFKKK